MVLGLFALCYLPGFVSVVVSVKIGMGRIPVVLRDTVVLLIVVQSALNPIIYMVRSNEFKRAFLKYFGRASVVPQVETNNTRTARSPPSRIELSVVCHVQNDRGEPPLLVPPILETPLARNLAGALLTTPSLHLSLDCCHDDRRPSFLSVPTPDPSSPSREQIEHFFDNVSFRF